MVAAVRMLEPEPPGRVRARAEGAERVEDWDEALEAWRAFNQSGSADADSWRGEARAALAQLAVVRRRQPRVEDRKRLAALEHEAGERLLVVVLGLRRAHRRQRHGAVGAQPGGQRSRELDDRAWQARAFAVAEGDDEAAVDLEDVHGQPLQV
ncbi:MAG: hypothetical protein KY433_12830 [Actinobacteria bacterium]|nr:hypothetical protein [Actinomycetota bacterium]